MRKFHSFSGFPAVASSFPSSAQAGRLRLPACAEEVIRGAHPSERRSFSASQAAMPQVAIEGTDRNLDKLGQALPLRHWLDRPLKGD